MADFVLSRKKAFTFALDSEGGKVYSIPDPSSLSFEATELLGKIGDEEDFVERGESVKRFLLCCAPDLADEGLGDMDYLKIVEAYFKAKAEKLGESKASHAS